MYFTQLSKLISSKRGALIFFTKKMFPQNVVNIGKSGGVFVVGLSGVAAPSEAAPRQPPPPKHDSILHPCLKKAEEEKTTFFPPNSETSVKKRCQSYLQVASTQHRAGRAAGTR